MAVLPAMSLERGALIRLGVVLAGGLLISGLAVQFSFHPMFVVTLGYSLCFLHDILLEAMVESGGSARPSCPTCGGEVGGGEA